MKRETIILILSSIISIISIIIVIFLIQKYKKYIEKLTPESKWNTDLKNLTKIKQLSSNDAKEVQNNIPLFNINYFWEIVKYLNIPPSSKLEILHSYFNFDYGNKTDEYPKQLLSVRYIRQHNRVLEIGGNIGRNSCIIASLLMNSKNLVVLESEHTKELEHNRNLNHLSFFIEPSALSARPLIQKDWNTKPYNGTIIPEGWKTVPTIHYSTLIKKYKIKFDTLVLDCEGAFYYILLDFPEILDNIQLIIMKNDFDNIEQGNWVHHKLEENGFRKIRVQSNLNTTMPFKDEFYQAWRRIKPLRIVHLVLYSDEPHYQQMYQLTRKYYAQFNNIRTIYYKFSKTISTPFEFKDDILSIKGEETFIPGILDKTIQCFEWVEKNIKNYDYVIRSNISTIINFEILVPLIQKEPIEYGGGLLWKHEYPIEFISGTCIIFSNQVFNKLVQYKDNFDRTLIDDVSIGKFIKENIPEVFPMVVLSEYFIFVPDCKGDENILKQHIHSKQYIFYRNRADDRNTDIQQMQIIISQLRPDLF